LWDETHLPNNIQITIKREHIFIILIVTGGLRTKKKPKEGGELVKGRRKESEKKNGMFEDPKH